MIQQPLPFQFTYSKTKCAFNSSGGKKDGKFDFFDNKGDKKPIGGDGGGIGGDGGLLGIGK